MTHLLSLSLLLRACLTQHATGLGEVGPAPREKPDWPTTAFCGEVLLFSRLTICGNPLIILIIAVGFFNFRMIVECSLRPN